jgi:hypothetical protein
MKTIKFKKGVFTTFFFMTVLFFSSASFAQENSDSSVSLSSSRSSRVTEFNEGNYQVKVLTLPNAAGYGYEIYAEGKLLVTQLSKPYFDEPSLFSSLANARIIAQYHAANLNSKDPGKLNIDVTKAKALGVSDEDLIIK